jgi:hypothetical protein
MASTVDHPASPVKHNKYLDTKVPGTVIRDMAETSGMMIKCTDHWHEWIRSSAERFRLETESIGEMGDGDGGILELGNCRLCHSTLALEWHEIMSARAAGRVGPL